MRKGLFYLALTGWITCLFFVISPFFGVRIPFSQSLISVFLYSAAALAFSTFYFLSQAEQNRGDGLIPPSGSMTVMEKFRVVFKHTPLLLKVIGIGGMLYFPYLIFSLNSLFPDGTTLIENGKYFLRQNGQIVRSLNEAEFIKLKAIESRIIIYPICIALYGYSMAFLYTPKNSK